MLNNKQIEELGMLGYFPDDCADNYVCNVAGCQSKVVNTQDKLLFIRTSTNTCNVSPAASFGQLTDKIVQFQNNTSSWEYFTKQPDGTLLVNNGPNSILCSTYVVAAKNNKRKSSRQATDNMLRVKSSNVWAYAFNVEQGKSTGDLYVQFKNKRGGAGDIYQYLDFPVRMWRKFVSTSSKGHFFWRFVRNRYKYRKLTGDKHGKLPNAIQ